MRRLVVGMPVYNGENYLDQALTAVRSQTFEDFTVVVSDNGSSDATPDIVEHHAAEDSRIVSLRQETNLGAAPNYNATYLAAPSSEYFCWIAHDDLPLPRFFEACIDALDADGTAVLAYANTKLIDPEGSEIGQRPPRPALASPLASIRLADVIDHRNGNHPVFGVMRRSALDRTGLHGSYTGSDRTLLAELAMLGPYIEVPELLFAVREHRERSVRTKHGAEAQSRETWFDSSRAGRIVFPRWRRLSDYLRAVFRAPVSATERRRSYRALARWLVDTNWKTLVFDVMVAAKQVTRRAARTAWRSES